MVTCAGRELLLALPFWLVVLRSLLLHLAALGAWVHHRLRVRQAVDLRNQRRAILLLVLACFAEHLLGHLRLAVQNVGLKRLDMHVDLVFGPDLGL